jgi:hypothetical protein
MLLSLIYHLRFSHRPATCSVPSDEWEENGGGGGAESEGACEEFAAAPVAVVPESSRWCVFRLCSL